MKKKFFCSGANVGLLRAPLASLTGPVAGDNTEDMLRHAFGYQASLTRHIDVGRVS